MRKKIFYLFLIYLIEIVQNVYISIMCAIGLIYPKLTFNKQSQFKFRVPFADLHFKLFTKYFER